MARIEVLAEMLVNELHQFSEDVKQLKEENKNLKEVKLHPDLEEFQLITQHHIDSLLAINKQQNIENELHFNRLSKLVRRKLPNHFIYIAVILVLSAFLYAFNAKLKLESEKKKEFTNGVEQANNHFLEFLKTDDKLMQTYEQWHASSK